MTSNRELGLLEYMELRKLNELLIKNGAAYADSELSELKKKPISLSDDDEA